jgi:uncharacterized protein (TIGR00725 family)
VKGWGGARPHEQQGGSVEPHPLPSERARQIAVIGSAGCGEEAEAWRLAEEVGRLLAEAGVTVVCGGGGGVMEAVARGAAGVGGSVIGVLPWVSVDGANPYCTQVVATGIGQARNLAVVASGEAAIAIGGEWGTLSEIAHARNLGRTVVTLRSWSVSGREEMEGGPGIVAVDTPEQAVAAALKAISP